MSDQVEGRQPVREALRAGREIDRILIARGVKVQGPLAEIMTLAREAGVRVERMPRAAIDRRAQTAVHQGVIAEVRTFEHRPWTEGLAAARRAGRAPLVLALDGITDPHNAGALLRTAHAFGVDAVLMPARRSVGMTAVVEKASAGAAEHLVIDRVSNLNRALDACRDEGLWVIALTSEGEQDISACGLLTEPCVLVVGAEGEGVSRLVAERADARCRIPMEGQVGSLNASVAGAICLWEVRRNRG